MEIESIMGNANMQTNYYTGSPEGVTPVPAVADETGKDAENQNSINNNNGKEPTKNTIDSAFSDMNTKIKQCRTRCEYSYDEPTKRITIKVFDDDTDELIREVPPEKSLEVLQKVWELAGIIVDKKL